MDNVVYWYVLLDTLGLWTFYHHCCSLIYSAGEYPLQQRKPPLIVQQHQQRRLTEHPPLLMTSMDGCRARFDTVREVFEPTKNYITKIVEKIGGVLYSPLWCRVEKGKDNLIGIITPNPEYVQNLVTHLRGRHTRGFTTKSLMVSRSPAVWKAKAVHKAKIQDWNLYCLFGVNIFFSILIFMPDLACCWKVWERALYCPKMSL